MKNKLLCTLVVAFIMYFVFTFTIELTEIKRGVMCLAITNLYVGYAICDTIEKKQIPTETSDCPDN